jgi:hypothetical protein
MFLHRFEESLINSSGLLFHYLIDYTIKTVKDTVITSINDIVRIRLFNQQLIQPRYSNPGELVKWLCAVQAQDYLGALWAVGIRLKKAVDADVEKALEEKSIVRSWPMRGTLHFVSHEDLRWMLKHLAPKVITRASSIYRQAALDASVFKKSEKILLKELSGKQMTREELYEVLEKNKIKTSDTRGLHILGYLAQQALICFGPRRGKQQTLVLLDEWLPPGKMFERGEALAELALRYTTGHGPAQVEDLAWWAGLTKKESLDALEANRGKIIEEVIDGKKYWLAPGINLRKIDKTRAFLIPTYDEMGVGYKDRSAMIDGENAKQSRNTIFTSAILIDGRVVGTWRRTIDKNHVEIEAKFFRTLSSIEKKAVETEAGRYSKFVAQDLRLLF